MLVRDERLVRAVIDWRGLKDAPGEHVEKCLHYFAETEDEQVLWADVVTVSLLSVGMRGPKEPGREVYDEAL